MVDVEIDPKPYRLRRKPEGPIWYIPPEQRRWEERHRLERLTKEAASWREARLLRDHVEAALRQLDRAADDDEARETRRAELEWLLGHANRIDPLSE